MRWNNLHVMLLRIALSDPLKQMSSMIASIAVIKPPGKLINLSAQEETVFESVSLM